MEWTINVTNAHDGAGREFRFGQAAVRVGRDPKVEICLDNAEMSRLHFTLKRRGDVLQINDSSRNGTFVRIDGSWKRVRGTTECPLPAELRAAVWTFGVADAEADPPPAKPKPAPLPVTRAEATWEQSIMLPAGYLNTVQEAILVFDLCESSTLASHDDHMAYHLKCRLTQMAEPVLVEHGRRFFKSTGDGFVATFANPAAALDAAVDLERRVQSRNLRTRNTPIHYRIALHYGDVWAIDAGGDDIHGNDVNITFRIEGVQADAFKAPHPFLPARDRILCSSDFMAAVPESCLTIAVDEVVACGAAELKGIAGTVGIHWLKSAYSMA